MNRSIRTDMLRAAGVFLAASAATLSTAARADDTTAARADDAKYCAALTKQYHQYIDETVGQGGPSSAAGGSLAMAQCAAGNTKDGIPVLERKLGNAKISLPQRSLASAPQAESGETASCGPEVYSAVEQRYVGVPCPHQ